MCFNIHHGHFADNVLFICIQQLEFILEVGNTVCIFREAEGTHIFILKNLQIGTNVGRIRIRIVIARDVFDPKRADNGLFVGRIDTERLADPSVRYQHERIVFAGKRIVKCKPVTVERRRA